MSKPPFFKNLIEKTAGNEIVLIFLAVLILGAPTLIYPFGRDQGQYAWIAASANNGHLIYHDIFEIKPPFTHFLHQAALLAFGHNMSAIRILDMFWQLATALLVYKIALQIEQPRRAGLFAAVLYLFAYYHMDFWSTAQTDGFLTLPVAAGILFFLQAHQKNSLRLYAASGAAVGLGVLFKYPIGILVVFLALLALLSQKKNGLFPLLCIGLGFAAPLAIGALIMFLRGNLLDFLWIQFIYIPNYSTIPHKDLSYAAGLMLGLLWALISPVPGWVSLCGVVGLATSANRFRWVQMTVIAAWWIAAVFHFVIQNKFYSYHSLPVYAPIALMMSSLFVDAGKRHGLIRFMLGAMGAVFVFHAFFSSDFPQKYNRLFDVALGHTTLEAGYGADLFDKGEDFSSRADLQVADYLRANTRDSQTIFIWGFEPGIYFLGQRQNATRFIYNITLYGPNANPHLQRVFLEEIQAQKPAYVVIVRNDSMSFVTATADDSWAAFNSFDEFHEFVLENYELDTTIQDFVIYRLQTK